MALSRNKNQSWLNVKQRTKTEPERRNEVQSQVSHDRIKSFWQVWTWRHDSQINIYNLNKISTLAWEKRGWSWPGRNADKRKNIITGYGRTLSDYRQKKKVFGEKGHWFFFFFANRKSTCKREIKKNSAPSQFLNHLKWYISKVILSITTSHLKAEAFLHLKYPAAF